MCMCIRYCGGVSACVFKLLEEMYEEVVDENY